MIPTMASAGQQPESLNIQLLVDSIPAMIHTPRPEVGLAVGSAAVRVRQG